MDYLVGSSGLVVGVIVIVMGFFLTITVIGAIVGIPMMIGGLVLMAATTGRVIVEKASGEKLDG